jgi:hypothetical protein
VQSFTGGQLTQAMQAKTTPGFIGAVARMTRTVIDTATSAVLEQAVSETKF